MACLYSDLVTSINKSMRKFDLLDVEENLQTYTTPDEYAKLSQNEKFKKSAAKLLDRYKNVHNHSSDYAIKKAIIQTKKKFI